VRDVKEISGNRTLSEAAEEAVRKWRFESSDGSATVDVAGPFAL
jgi:outer membrane biosynthesis protein TonB